MLFVLTAASSFADESDEFFERQIRPILVEKCSRCHGAEKQNGGLRVDSIASLLQGGESGPAVVRGSINRSLLIQAVMRSDDIAMPPDETLPQHQVDALKQWIDEGAVWPATIGNLPSMKDSSMQDHWAFQPVSKPEVPQTSDDWIQTSVDAFILKKLHEHGLTHASSADRRTLLRRASYVLTGLPPSPELVEEFVGSNSADAWSQQVDRLLASPQYGEHWGRHWLDVARYADTKGYVYAREERFWVHAWAYRDWVVNSLNADMPYDRFLLLQLAADQVTDRNDGDLAAMGFLTLGRRFLGIKHDIIDDRIDVVSRGTMGLTVACARCHDHKYDPIPTADYYSLYGVFDSCAEQLVPVGGNDVDDAEFMAELQKRQEKLQQTLKQRCGEASERYRSRVGDYLLAQTELSKYPQAGFDQIITAQDTHPRIVWQWQKWLYDSKRNQEPVFKAWHEYQQLPSDDFANLAIAVTAMLAELTPLQLNPVVAEAFRTAPTSFAEVVDRYAKLLAEIDAKWKTKSSAASEDGSTLAEFSDSADEQLRLVLYGAGSPCVVPEEHIANTELLHTSSVLDEIWKLQGEVDRWIIQSKHNAAYATTLVDREFPSEPRVFRRGNPATPTTTIARHFLTALGEQSTKPFQIGSGRLELAQSIIDPSNPLTARVIVNRVWTQVFGRGLVSTPSDFGLRAETPSHPELLDWLTTWFIDNGWSLKKLHRLLLTSAAFQQQSRNLPADIVQAAEEIDPENRLLWRMSSRRLSFEQFRDSLLQASAELNLAAGGKPFDLFQPGARQPRRTIYGLVDRQYLPGVLRTFDFPNPDLHVAQRSQTTVPQQALFFMNHELVLEQTRLLAKKSESLPDNADRVRFLFQRVLQRAPSDSELHDALQLVSATTDPAPQSLPTAGDWSYGYGEVDETNHAVKDFQAAPHFTGSAWQGGEQWPDAKLGWVNLTAVGGHPGNTRQHACVRRWTAPRDMTIRIESRLVHEPEVGDGVRAFVLANGQTLHKQKVHQATVALDTERVDVKQGTMIDFVVDIDEILNSDQFLWRITLSDVNPADGNSSGLVWNSESDFTANTVDHFSPWEQLAHVLLCTNEFMFVD